MIFMIIIHMFIYFNRIYSSRILPIVLTIVACVLSFRHGRQKSGVARAVDKDCVIGFRRAVLRGVDLLEHELLGPLLQLLPDLVLLFF